MATHSVRFDRRLYAEQAVLDATSAFADFGVFTTEGDEAAISVGAEIDDAIAERVWGEFLNYVLVSS